MWKRLTGRHERKTNLPVGNKHNLHRNNRNIVPNRVCQWRFGKHLCRVYHRFFRHTFCSLIQLFGCISGIWYRRLRGFSALRASSELTQTNDSRHTSNSRKCLGATAFKAKADHTSCAFPGPFIFLKKFWGKVPLISQKSFKQGQCRMLKNKCCSTHAALWGPIFEPGVFY